MMQTNVSIGLKTQLKHARLLTFSIPPDMAPIKLTDDLFSIQTRVTDKNDDYEPMYNITLNYYRKGKDKEQFYWIFQNGLTHAMLDVRFLPIDSKLVTANFKDIEKDIERFLTACSDIS